MPVIEPALPVLTEVVSAAPSRVQDYVFGPNIIVGFELTKEGDTGALVALALIYETSVIFKSISICFCLVSIPPPDRALLTRLLYPAATGLCQGREHD